jgi:hypothetical protein
MPNFTYDPASRRYRSVGTGQYVTSKQVRAAVDTVIDGYQADVVAVASKLQAGELSLAEWQLQTAQALKALHVATAAAANGGFNNMSQSDYGFVGSLVKKQYAYLRDFAGDIASGKQLVASSSFLARVKLYAQAARGTYESVATRAAKIGGVLKAKRELGAADSCPGCLGEAKRGWVPIEEVAPIGSQECLTNCRCEIIFQ